MKYAIFAALVLMPAIAFADECGEETVPAAPAAEWISCTSDADCITFKSYCEWHIVNKTHKREIDEYLQKRYCLDRIEYECSPASENTPQPIATCIANKCIVPKVTH